MKPEPIPTKSSEVVSYALLTVAALVFVTLLAAFLHGGLVSVLSEVGRLLVGVAKR